MIRLFSSMGSGSACNTVVGAGSLPTARKLAIGLVIGQKWRVNTSSPTSMSFLNATAPIRLIGGGFCRTYEWNGVELLLEKVADHKGW